ncbi:MAG: Hsp20/alpha crystallin family protein [Burkholderiales bacterium]|nr:MAG: Hsp20/alpha crystallin family protein [Burkholderiales bacterium]
MYESLLTFPGGLFGELDRMQRDLQQAFGTFGRPSSIRAVPSGSFPAINIGHTATAIEVYAFAPGIDPASLEVSVDRGLLTIAGERVRERLGDEPAKRNVYASERFGGRFRRVLSLPDDADPERIEARYRDGVLRITVSRRESTLPRRIEIQ